MQIQHVQKNQKCLKHSENFRNKTKQGTWRIQRPRMRQGRETHVCPSNSRQTLKHHRNGCLRDTTSHWFPNQTVTKTSCRVVDDDVHLASLHYRIKIYKKYLKDHSESHTITMTHVVKVDPLYVIILHMTALIYNNLHYVCMGARWMAMKCYVCYTITIHSSCSNPS